MKVYEALTVDRYELPIFQTDNVQDLSRLTGVPARTIYELISKKSSGLQIGYKFVRIEFEDIPEVFEDNPKTDIAIRIKTARKKLKLTQQQMGDMLGVCKNTITDWEKGHSIPREPEKVLAKLGI